MSPLETIAPQQTTQFLSKTLTPLLKVSKSCTLRLSRIQI
jgi:hypothetical protein